jgi:hypothetical protein
VQLSQLKLKLEEKRREIERNKQRQEMATAKLRQRMGKMAFMRVISKTDETSGIASALSQQPSLIGGDVSNNSSATAGKTSLLRTAVCVVRLHETNKNKQTNKYYPQVSSKRFTFTFTTLAMLPG